MKRIARRADRWAVALAVVMSAVSTFGQARPAAAAEACTSYPFVPIVTDYKLMLIDGANSAACDRIVPALTATAKLEIWSSAAGVWRPAAEDETTEFDTQHAYANAVISCKGYRFPAYRTRASTTGMASLYGTTTRDEEVSGYRQIECGGALPTDT